MAIAHTLTEFAEVSYVSVLVGGREEGFDLAASMPVGALSRVEDLDVSSRYVRLDELLKNPQDAGISRLTVLRFPSLDGRWILPEVRSVTYAGLKPIECLYTVLEEIGRGTDNPLAMDVPAPMDYIEDMPEIIRYEEGDYRAIELRFSGELDDALVKAGLTRGAYLALLTDTLTGFVPGVDGDRSWDSTERRAGVPGRPAHRGAIGERRAGRSGARVCARAGSLGGFRGVYGRARGDVSARSGAGEARGGQLHLPAGAAVRRAAAALAADAAAP